MSLTHIYVLANDGKLYRDPILYDQDWFLCFDDEDDPELVIDCKSRAMRLMIDRARQILDSIGLDATVESEYPNVSGRIFPPYDKAGKSKIISKAAAFWLTIHEPIPFARIKEHHGSMTVEQFRQKPRCAMVWYFGEDLELS